MHMKRVLIVSDDAHTQAWVSQALAGLDLQSSVSSLGDMQRRLLDGVADLVILDGGRSPEVLAQVVEHAASGGVDLRLIVLVESEGLEALRLPVRVPSDFMVRGGSSDELAARTRTMLWPGEEVTRQELVRIDRLTLNLATYQAYSRWRAHRLHLPRVRAVRLPGDPPWADLLPRGAVAASLGHRTTTADRERSTCTSGVSAPRSATSCPGGSRPCATSATSGTDSLGGSPSMSRYSIRPRK